MILNLAHAESRLIWWYLVFMAVAGLIAAVGLIQNLPVLLVGAMSLSPDLAPTNSIAVALTTGAFHDFRRSLRTLALGLGVATAVAFFLTLFLELTGVIESGTFFVSDHLVTFVTVVNGSSVIVALAAGVAAMVAFVTGQARGAVGVRSGSPMSQRQHTPGSPWQIDLWDWGLLRSACCWLTWYALPWLKFLHW